MSNPLPPIGELLRQTAPDRLAIVLERYVKAHHGGSHVEVLLADYRISGLWPVLRDEHDTAGSLSETASAPRAFGSQRTVLERLAGSGGTRALIPLSVWAERLGVLVVDLPAEPDQAVLEGLRKVADELAVALMAADRSTDRYRRTRRRQRLTMAAEMQWELLPGRALGGPNFLLAGQLEPAYGVCGDHFDWALTGDTLTVTVLNGGGSGIEATLLTVVAVNAMRNARRSGGNLVEQAELASDAVYSLHGGQHHVATLLLEVELGTGAVTTIDAGSPHAFRMRGSHVTAFQFDQQLPLGMFADTRYDVQTFTLEPADRLFVVSDGVHAAAPGGLPPYETKGLMTAIRGTRLLPATEAVGSVMRGLHEYHAHHDLADDAVIVCLDWHGGTDASVEVRQR